MSEKGSSHPALKLTLKFVLNVVVVGVMSMYLNHYFALDGGFAAYVIVGSLITLMNLFVRPVLNILTAPLKLFATIIAMIIVNGGFVQLVVMITDKMDPNLVQLEIFGGLWGWIVVMMCLGLANSVLNRIFK